MERSEIQYFKGWNLKLVFLKAQIPSFQHEAGLQIPRMVISLPWKIKSGFIFTREGYKIDSPSILRECQ
ncbi:hypothetical protein [Coxiella burnetii]|uniref:hypothetical protein n=1 Tax=Coxiella burnetii TaxID=777 RepID=UPI000CCC7852|nr:hypothetical protein [Coxiella burnetii]PNT89944.1 hypothetical protein C2L89_01970 [Coxiella burnetii]